MDCSGMIFSLIEEAASTGAVYSFALNRYWGPGQNPMWDQSWGVLHLMTVGSNGEGNVLLWGPHWYGLPNLTVDDPVSLELAEGAIWFGYNLGDPPQRPLPCSTRFSVSAIRAISSYRAQSRSWRPITSFSSHRKCSYGSRSSS